MGPDPEKFISQAISVSRDEASGKPISFTWNGRVHAIREIIAVWPDWGFSSGSPKRKNWRMRRHRNYYRVETADGEVFELYHDRGIKGENDTWVLQTQIT